MKHLRLASALAVLTLLATVVAAWAYYTTAGEGTSAGTVGSMTAPTISAPAASTGSHAVTWTGQASVSSGDDSEIQYFVERKLDSGSFQEITSGGCDGPLPHGTTSCTDTATASGSYTYRVIAKFRSWTATSNEAGAVVVTLNVAPAAPTSVALANGGGTGNAYINSANKSSLNVNVGLGASSLATDTVHVTITDGTHTTVDKTASATTGTGTVTVTGIDATSLDDGSVTIRATSANAGGTSSPTTTAVTKDTAAPNLQTLEMLDADVDGLVDQVKATFGETLESTTNNAPWTLANIPSGGTKGTLSTSGSLATLLINEGAGTSSTAVGSFTVALAQSATGIRDAAGNQSSFAAQAPTDKAAPIVYSINRANSNPTNASSVAFTVVFTESVTGVGTGDFALMSGSIANASVASTSGSGSTYTVNVSTGTGDGTVGLRLVDDDSIQDSSNNKLHGTGTTGAGDGSVSGGQQTYTVDKTAPTVSSISRVSSSPTNASSVQWTVTFSESVTGVTISPNNDFALAQSGGVSGASITGITGSGATYTVTASTGSGNGTLGLNLVDDDSIRDAVNQRLGGTGTGNGNFTGETYAIDKSAPSLQTLEMFDADNDGKVDRVDATFSETLETSGANVTDGWSSSNQPGGVSLDAVTVSGSKAEITFTGGTAGTNSTTPAQTAGNFTLTLSSSTGQIRDSAGNKASFSNQTPTDKASPVPTALTDADGSTAGKFQQNDTVTLTFTEDVTNSATTSNVVLTGGANGGTDDIWRAPGFLNGTSDTSLGRVDYMLGNSNVANFNSSALSRPANNQIRLTLGACSASGTICTATSGSNRLGTAADVGDVAVTPSTTIKDAANNTALPNSGSTTFSIQLF